MKKKQEKPGYKNINIIDCFMLKMQLHNTITRFNLSSLYYIIEKLQFSEILIKT